METLTSEEKAPGAVPSRMLAAAETMIESFMLILEYYGNESGGACGACGACEVTWSEEFQSCFLPLPTFQGVVFNTMKEGPDRLVVQIVTVFVKIVTKYT
jgi:aerobic-type carbon monoxide dehydrogenase small subunit (CoxS/CutS family)